MIETEWFEGRKVDEHQRHYWRRILGEIAVAVLIGITAVWATGANAEPRFAAEGDNGAVITLYDDPCELKEQITNLPFKATWTEGEKRFEGCWAPVQQLGIAQMWFTDKTAFPVPLQALKRVQGA
jgi:hypothetical protein